MKTVSGIRCQCQRLPPAIVHAARLCVRFNLGRRAAEEMPMERGIDLSHETIRRWTVKFGPQIARNLRRRRCRPGDVWHLDEVAAKREAAPGLGNRAANSHLPFRKVERAMQGYRSPGALQRFASVRSAIRDSFSDPARRPTALAFRCHRMEAIDAWRSAVGIA
ncbi:hypothetical protein [Mangrovicoccus ximenensis]